MSTEVKNISYTKKVVYPIINESITINSAKCKKCDDVIKSISEVSFVKCKCSNVAIRGGKKFILHQLIEKHFY